MYENIVSKLALLVLAAAGVAACGESRTVDLPEVRITIVAKDQAFHLEDNPSFEIPPSPLNEDRSLNWCCATRTRSAFYTAFRSADSMSWSRASTPVRRCRSQSVPPSAGP